MALDFDGSADYVQYAAAPASITGAQTFLCTLWLDSASSGTDQRIVDIRQSGGAFVIKIDWLGTQTKWQFVAQTTTGANVIVEATSATPSFDAWFTLGYSWAGGTTATGCEIWLNGTDVADGYTSAGGGSDRTTSGVWEFCRRPGTPDRHVDGRLANVGYWNRALSAAEVAIYHATRNPYRLASGLVFAPFMFAGALDQISQSSPTDNSAGSVEHPPMAFLTAPTLVMGGAAAGAINASLTLAASAGFTPSALAQFESALTLAGSAGFAPAANADMQASTTLAGSAGMTPASTADMQASVTLASSAGLTLAATADMQAALALAGSAGYAPEGGLDLQAALTMAASAGLSLTNDVSIEGAVTFAAAAAMAPTVAAVFDAQLDLDAVADLALSVLADMRAAASLGAVAGQTFSATLTTDAGITLAAQATYSVDAITGIITVTVPDGRTLTIQASDRTLTIEAGDRTLTVQAGDRTLTIH